MQASALGRCVRSATVGRTRTIFARGRLVSRAATATRVTRLSLLVVVFLVTSSTSGGSALAIDVGSDGSDGDFTPVANVEVRLDLAADGSYNTPSPVPGQGVYDGNKWAVVYKYSSVNIPAGVTVTFRNHPSHAPVVWLVQGNVTIDGTVSLDGKDYTTTGVPVAGGPGGFRGGRGTYSADSRASAGYGPGGGGYQFYGPTGDDRQGTGGSFASPGSGYFPGITYGSPQLLPLIGGSGGSGDGGTGIGGGGGGGAVLIAANGTISLGGVIRAQGGNSTTGGIYGQVGGGSGSGGAIRLIADVVQGAGSMYAAGGTGGRLGGGGRIRVEGNTISLANASVPDLQGDTPSDPPQIWPPAEAPTVSILQVGAEAAPSDPRGDVEFGRQDISFVAPAPLTVKLTAQNVPRTWNVIVRVVPKSGQDFTVPATCDTVDDPCPSWTSASFMLPNSFSAIQARASAP